VNTLTAFTIGLFGSAHCLGMCGPIIVAVHSKQGNPLLYQLGRIGVYVLLGAIAGGIGSTFSVMAGQQIFSIVLGAVLVIMAISYVFFRGTTAIEKFISHQVVKFSGWIHAAGFGPNGIRLLMGVANGLLPCGLVYLAMAGAASTFTPWEGAAFMAAFGAGTLPALLLVTYFGTWLSAHLRSKLRTLIPVTIFLMGALLLVRGMNLGIPYLSPQQISSDSQVTNCH